MKPWWYLDTCVYQLDPSVFCDSDGDGHGDLRGVAERLEHLRGLGVTCLWMLPVYASPFRDGGYDVTDHLAVDPRFGDLADLVALLEKAEELGLRVMLDLVVQHTSDQHPWFQEARRDRSSPYRDYYVWTDDPENDPATKEPVFPTEEESVWTWDEVAGQYYRHLFYSHEPDLNHANPAVFEEICRIMGFWLRLGISGFRVDALAYMVERAAQRDDIDGDGFWLVREMRDFVDQRHPQAVLMGEADLPPDGYADYFAEGRGFQLLLDFWANNHLFLALARQDAAPLVEALAKQADPPEHAAYATFLRNHDELDLERLSDVERDEVLDTFAPEQEMRAYGRGIRRRLAPMLEGDDARLAMAHALTLSLPGVPVLLYGDEIGLGDDLDRPERLAVRTPMQWTDGPSAGFSTAPREAWVTRPVPDAAYGPDRRNVYTQIRDADSLLAKVGNLVRTRIGLHEVGAGRCETFDVQEPSVLAVRHLRDGAEVLMLTNLADREVAVELPAALPEDLVDLLADRDYPAVEPGQRLRLGPYGYRWLRPKAALFA